MAFVAKRLQATSGENPLSQALSAGMWDSVLVYLVVDFFRQVCRTDGLAAKHFHWHDRSVRCLRQNFSWLLVWALPLLVTIYTIAYFENGKWQNSLGRIFFILVMMLFAISLHFVLRPYKNSAKGIWSRADGYLFRYRYLCYAIAVLIPVFLSILASVGYLYSAEQLAIRLNQTVWLVMFLSALHAICMRWLLVARRRVAMKQWQEQQQQNAANSEEVNEFEEIDLDSIREQLNRLMRGGAIAGTLLGLSFIWADMVPALLILDRVELWTTTQEFAETVTDETGALRRVSNEQVVAITLGHLMTCLLVLALTVFASRNLPGLLRITVLERLPIDKGARHALSLVSGYLISLLGTLIAFSTIGVTWQSVQWLAAAMTVGLGFGLQEIFANFVSGLIILTERPIRVGDFVTVGGLTGKVTRMQFRATTITDFDRRELVVPNKKFITDNVVNWTLSDPISRITVSVGIAYACDPATARDVLLKVARQNPLILNEPAPTAIFTGFGDSTLNLELRAFIHGREQYPEIQNDINLAVNRAFREANLEIAFPQRDINIRAIPTEMLRPELKKVSDKAA